MPKLVDHEARRDALADVTVMLVATAGLRAVTIRSVAAAAGFSTAVVTHYFEGKRQLLLYTYKFVSGRAYRRIEATARADGNLAATLAAALPTTEESRRDWLVWSVFLALAISDPEFSEMQREQYDIALRWLENLLRHEGEEMDPAPTDRARALLSFLIGLGMQAAFDPGPWPASLQASLLLSEIEAKWHRR